MAKFEMSKNRLVKPEKFDLDWCARLGPPIDQQASPALAQLGPYLFKDETRNLFVPELVDADMYFCGGIGNPFHPHRDGFSVGSGAVHLRTGRILSGLGDLEFEIFHRGLRRFEALVD